MLLIGWYLQYYFRKTPCIKIKEIFMNTCYLSNVRKINLRYVLLWFIMVLLLSLTLSNHLILSISITFMCIIGANISLCRSLSSSSFLPLALPSFVLPVSPGFLFISHCPVGVCLRWRVCRSCPLWQADSSGPDVEPGPAEQIMLTQLSRARQRQAELSGLQSGALSSFFPAVLRSLPHQN